MRRKHWLALLAALLVAVAGFTGGVASSGIAIDWWSMASGGGASSVGTVTINDTIGQPIVGASASTDGKTVLGAGYWPSLGAASAEPGGTNVYLPLVIR